MGFAMNQYLQDGMGKYDQMRDDNIFVIPAFGNLAKKERTEAM